MEGDRVCLALSVAAEGGLENAWLGKMVKAMLSNDSETRSKLEMFKSAQVAGVKIIDRANLSNEDLLGEPALHFTKPNQTVTINDKINNCVDDFNQVDGPTDPANITVDDLLALDPAEEEKEESAAKKPIPANIDAVGIFKQMQPQLSKMKTEDAMEEFEKALKKTKDSNQNYLDKVKARLAEKKESLQNELNEKNLAVAQAEDNLRNVVEKSIEFSENFAEKASKVIAHANQVVSEMNQPETKDDNDPTFVEKAKKVIDHANQVRAEMNLPEIEDDDDSTFARWAEKSRARAQRVEELHDKLVVNERALEASNNTIKKATEVGKSENLCSSEFLDQISDSVRESAKGLGSYDMSVDSQIVNVATEFSEDSDGYEKVTAEDIHLFTNEELDELELDESAQIALAIRKASEGIDEPVNSSDNVAPKITHPTTPEFTKLKLNEKTKLRSKIFKLVNERKYDDEEKEFDVATLAVHGLAYCNWYGDLMELDLNHVIDRMEEYYKLITFGGTKDKPFYDYLMKNYPPLGVSEDMLADLSNEFANVYN